MLESVLAKNGACVEHGAYIVDRDVMARSKSAFRMSLKISVVEAAGQRQLLRVEGANCARCSGGKRQSPEKFGGNRGGAHFTVYIFPASEIRSRTGVTANAMALCRFRNSRAFILVLAATPQIVASTEFALTTSTRNFIDGTPRSDLVVNGKVCRDRCGYDCAAFGKATPE